MTKPNSQTITIANQAHTITADNRARFRFSESGGKFGELLSATEGYTSAIKALHACLDDAGRARYPNPIDLCDHVEPLDHAIWVPVFTALASAGWVNSAEEIMAEVERATAALDAESKA